MEFLNIFWILLGFGGLGFTIYYSFIEQANKKAAWQEFANQNQLTLIPGSFLFEPTRVIGEYRQRQIELTTYKESKQTFTRLNLYGGHGSVEKPSRWPEEAKKPTAWTITEFLTPSGRPYYLKGRIEIGGQGRDMVYKESGIIKDPTTLKRLADLLADIALGYSAVVSLGGAAVPALQEIATGDHILRTIAPRLLEEIADDTARRFSHYLPDRLCPDCLTEFGPHEVSLNWWRTLTYYGCRTCGQSVRFIEDRGRSVMVLDQQMTAGQLERGRMFIINWLVERELFDFDEVEIIQASDEEVERFAVQVGNDTDPLRKPRYQKMGCVVSPDCRLSENTLRILERMFGWVTVGETVHTSTHLTARQPAQSGVEVSVGETQAEA
jgi:hypothetical protein